MLNKEKIIINDDVVPILNVSVIEKKPIDNLELEFQNTKNGYVAVLFYDMPYSASKVFVEYSSDGINWISEEQEDIRDQAILMEMKIMIVITIKTIIMKIIIMKMIILMRNNQILLKMM